MALGHFIYLFIFKGDTQACGSPPFPHFPLKASHKAASNQGSSYMADKYPSLVPPNYVQGPACPCQMGLSLTVAGHWGMVESLPGF